MLSVQYGLLSVVDGCRVVLEGAGANSEGLSMVNKVFAVSASAGKGMEAMRNFLRDSLPQVRPRLPLSCSQVLS